jgi:hypothetical protein
MTSQHSSIGIIVGPIREVRFGDRPASWIHNLAPDTGANVSDAKMRKLERCR